MTSRSKVSQGDCTEQTVFLSARGFFCWNCNGTPFVFSGMVTLFNVACIVLLQGSVYLFLFNWLLT